MCAPSDRGGAGQCGPGTRAATSIASVQNAEGEALLRRREEPLCLSRPPSGPHAALVLIFLTPTHALSSVATTMSGAGASDA